MWRAEKIKKSVLKSPHYGIGLDKKEQQGMEKIGSWMFWLVPL
jgi:hypothetical protein